MNCRRYFSYSIFVLLLCFCPTIAYLYLEERYSFTLLLWRKKFGYYGFLLIKNCRCWPVLYNVFFLIVLDQWSDTRLDHLYKAMCTVQFRMICTIKYARYLPTFSKKKSYWLIIHLHREIFLCNTSVISLVLEMIFLDL